MNKAIDLILKIALSVSIVVTAIIDNAVIKWVVVLLLGLLTIVLTIIKLKTNGGIKIQDQAADIIALIVIASASIFIIFKMIQGN